MSRECVFVDHRRDAFVRCKALERPWTRMRGLLGSDAGVGPVALVGCSSIHTMWMKYPLDVAFVSSDGVVTAAYRQVPPFRFLGSRGSWYVLERPSQGGYWPEVGDVLDASLEEEVR